MNDWQKCGKEHLGCGFRLSSIINIVAYEGEVEEEKCGHEDVQEDVEIETKNPGLIGTYDI